MDENRQKDETQKNGEASQLTPEAARRARNQNMLEWYDALVFALAVLVAFFILVARVVAVDGSSMLPTLTNGDRLILRSAGYRPAAGDIVVIDSYINYGRPLVKRIVALAGDTVEIDPEAGVVLVNGQPLAEPYAAEPTTELGDMAFPAVVPEGSVFVMGDNRQHSTDSRFSSVGFIDERDILGKAIFRVFPLGRAGWLA